MSKITAPLILVTAATMLAACGENFGYSKNPPDEFNVVKNPPLIMPPDYNLRPPGTGSSIANQVTEQELAKLVVLKPQRTGRQPSSAEQKLISKAENKGNSGDGIREVLTNSKDGTVSLPADTVDGLVKDAPANAQ